MVDVLSTSEPLRQAAARTGEQLYVNAYGQTDTGEVREQNQDHFLIAALHRQLDVLQSSLGAEVTAELCHQTQGWVFVVADGMGGHAGGAEASALTVETSLKYLRNLLPLFLRMDLERPDLAEEALRSVAYLCHEDVLDHAAAAPPNESQMGTTLTLAFVLWPELFVVHVGDSRCYLLRDGRMRQITRDHTMAQEMIDGGLDPEIPRTPGWKTY